MNLVTLVLCNAFSGHFCWDFVLFLDKGCYGCIRGEQCSLSHLHINCNGTTYSALYNCEFMPCRFKKSEGHSLSLFWMFKVRKIPQIRIQTGKNFVKLYVACVWIHSLILVMVLFCNYLIFVCFIGIYRSWTSRHVAIWCFCYFGLSWDFGLFHQTYKLWGTPKWIIFA